MRYALNLGISAYQLDLGATGREKETLGECKGRQLRLPNGAGTGEQTDEAGSSPIACGSPPGLETKLEWFSVAGTEPAMVCSGQLCMCLRFPLAPLLVSVERMKEWTGNQENWVLVSPLPCGCGQGVSIFGLSASLQHVRVR